MNSTKRTDGVVEHLIRWANQHDQVRAVILTSSRAIPDAPVDLFSDYDWSIKFGPYGRRLKQHLRPDWWTELEGTYTGAELEANWEALFRSIDLMRRVATEVGKHLGFTYPQELDHRAVNYLQKVKQLDRNATDFS